MNNNIPECSYPKQGEYSRVRLLISVFIQITFSFISKVFGNTSFDPAKVEITHHQIILKGLDEAFRGYRLIHISDIHMGTWMNVERLGGIVDMVNGLDPDLVAITGDFLSYTVDRPLEELSGPLQRLAPKDGTVAVLGNHDHWTDPGKVRGVLSDAGVIEVPNTHYTVWRGSACLHIAGVDDASAGEACLPQVLKFLPEDGGAILLADEPDFAEFTEQTGRFGLQLSGHSHGGQIVLPGIGPPFLPTYARKYPSGMYKLDGLTVYTNRGLGTSALRLRINCPPEITVFEFV